MQVDLNDIKIPTEKLNIVVSESLEKVKKSIKRTVSATLQADALRRRPALQSYPVSAYPIL